MTSLVRLDSKDPSQSRPGAASGDTRRRSARRWSTVAWAILVIGFVASLAVAHVWRAQANLEGQRSFDAEATEVGSTVATALLRTNDLAISARAFLLSQPNLGNRKLSTWWGNMAAKSRFGGVVGFGYIEVVPAAGLPRFAAQLSKDPIPGDANTGPTSHIVEPRRSYYCLARLGVASPLNATLLTPGTDFCSIPGFDAIQAARDSGQLMALTLAGRIVVLFSPVYKGGGIPPTVAMRRNRISGVIAELVNVQSILGQALAGHHDLQVGVAARDFIPITSAPTGIAAHFAMRLGSLSPVASIGSVHGPAFRKTVIANADGQWAVTISKSRDNTFLTPGLQALIILAGGWIVSALAFLLVHTLSTSRARALRVVEERTQQLRHQALHDSLTGLPNRKLLIERAEHLLEDAQTEGRKVAALFVDIDDFKSVNDTLGHLAGDELLRDAARRIVTALRVGDTVGRMGGDEFVVLAAGRPADGGPERLAMRLLDAMSEPFTVAAANDVRLSVSLSVGIAMGPHKNAEQMLGDADVALYRAKTAGKNRYVVFSPEMRGIVEDGLFAAKKAVRDRKPAGRQIA